MPGAATCSDCPGGRYGAAPGMANASCSGPCSPGHACAAGSTNATATVCPAGQYSAVAAAACTPCSPGLYGASPGQSSPQCSGACAAGRYGATTGATSPTCDGPCAAGYACGEGSTSPTAQLCPAGTYAVEGGAVCTNCSAGRFGASPGAVSAMCSGQCQVGRQSRLLISFSPGNHRMQSVRVALASLGLYFVQAGFFCPAGSVTPTSQLCPAGYACPTGTANGTE